MKKKTVSRRSFIKSGAAGAAAAALLPGVFNTRDAFAAKKGKSSGMFCYRI